MALTPPKRPQPGSHKEPLDDFDWPPSDEELGFAWPPTDEELAQNSPLATSAVPPATSAVPLVVPALVDAPALAHENPPMPAESKRASADRESVVFNASVSDLPAPGSSEFLRPAAPDDARNETRPKPSDVDESQHSGTGNP